MQSFRGAERGTTFDTWLTLKVNVLVHLPVHVGVCVSVDVIVDFGVDFGGGGRAPLSEEKLLLSQILLIVYGAQAVLLWAGGRDHKAPVPLPVGQPVGGLQDLGRRSAGWGTVLFTLAEPQQHCTKDEHHASRDANDDRPGEGAGGWGEHRGDGWLGVWQNGEEGAAEAVAHGVGAQADVHARVLLLGTGDEQLVEVGAIRA